MKISYKQPSFDVQNAAGNLRLAVPGDAPVRSEPLAMLDLLVNVRRWYASKVGDPANSDVHVGRYPGSLRLAIFFVGGALSWAAVYFAVTALI